MTTIYVTSTRRVGRKPSRKAANPKKQPEDATSPSSTAGKLKSFVGGGAELVDGLLTDSLNRFECLNNNDEGVDDSIEVQFLDFLLDDDKPIVPSMCPGDPDDKMFPEMQSSAAGVDRSLDVSTDETHVNTSAEESLSPGGDCVGHSFLSCSTVACGKSGEESFVLEDREEENKHDGYNPSPDLKKNNTPFADLKRSGWVPRAVANVLDNVIDSNWLCQTMNRSGLTPEHFKGKERKNKNPRRKKSKSRVPKAMPLPSPLVPSPSDNADYIKEAFDQALFQTSKKNLYLEKEGETTPKKKTKDTEETTPVSFSEEPVVGRKLFSLEDQLGLLDDGDGSQSTVMTSNNSALPHLSGVPIDSFEQEGEKSINRTF